MTSVTEGFPTVRVPVLSKTTVSTFAGPLEVLAALDQDAALRPLARPDEERGGRGDPEGARAGDHDHRDEDEHRVVETDVAEVEPGQAPRPPPRR